MDATQMMSVASSLVGLIGGPISLYFSWKAANKSSQAVAGAEELSRRMTSRRLYKMDGSVDVAGEQKPVEVEQLPLVQPGPEPVEPKTAVKAAPKQRAVRKTTRKF